MSDLVFYYFKVLKTSLDRFKFNLFNFGIKLAFITFLGELAYFKSFKKFKLSQYLLKKRGDAIHNTLEKKFSNLIEEYKNNNISVGENSKKIWFMRWEGIRDDNLVVKKSFASVNKYCGDYEVVLITEDNYTDYADIPSEIIDGVNDGRISIAHLSDIMRVYLLSRHGGIWVDSTMLFFDNIFDEFDNSIFNSPSVNGGKWCVFFMGGKASKLFAFVYDFLIQYNLRYDKFIDYFLLDHALRIAYENFEDCRQYVNGGTLENSEVFYLLEHFSQAYNKKDFGRLTDQYKYFKISDKPSVDTTEYDCDGNLTIYGYFKNKLEF